MLSQDYITHWIRNYSEDIPHSRVHALKTMGKNCYVKRDDELSFGVSGSKLRKYASLLPFLKARGSKEAVLSGNPFSNHILGLTQLLIENQIKPTLFLLKNRETIPLEGNFLLLSLFIDENQIHWVPEEDWCHLNEIISQYVNNHPNSVQIPSGAFMPEALPGAISLPLNILKNEEELGFEFSDIFIEAGTGLSAIALILGLAGLQKKAKVHVILLADTPDVFSQKLEEMREIFNGLTSIILPKAELQNQFEVYIPSEALSFGSTNATIFKEIKRIARSEGFLLDPIYSAKLFFESRKIIEKQELKGPILLIHSGGGLTLIGFEKQLQRVRVVKRDPRVKKA